MTHEMKLEKISSPMSEQHFIYNKSAKIRGAIVPKCPAEK
jgi:hypothetical protein